MCVFLWERMSVQGICLNLVMIQNFALHLWDCGVGWGKHSQKNYVRSLEEKELGGQSCQSYSWPVDPKDSLTAKATRRWQDIRWTWCFKDTRWLREFSSENLEGSSGSRPIRDKSGLWLGLGLAFIWSSGTLEQKTYHRFALTWSNRTELLYSLLSWVLSNGITP